MPKIFDTHCHYNLEPLSSAWADHWAKAQSEGVVASMIVGTDLASNQIGLELTALQPNWYAAVGFHPTDTGPDFMDQLDSSVAEMETWLQTADQIRAIGEVGLDYYWLPDNDTKATAIAHQKTVFTTQIKLANRYQLPLIIHARDKGEQAYWDILELLDQHFDFQRPFILHCVSGPLDYIQAALKKGAYLGVAGNVTYHNADHIRSIVRLAPTDRLLTETDAPFLPPQPHRGSVCEPWMIRLTAEYVATELGQDLDQLYQNALRVFNLEPENVQ